MSEIEEDAGSSVSDLENNEIKPHNDIEALIKQRNELENQLKREVQKMAPSDASTRAQTKVNASNLTVPKGSNKRAKKGNDTASDMSSAEESEELNTDDSTDATNDDDDERNGTKTKAFEKVTRERRQSNLVRINTQTKWSDDQLDSLQGELLDQMSQMAAQGGHGNTDHLLYTNFQMQHSQNMNGSSDHNFVHSNGVASTNAAVAVQQKWPLQDHTVGNNQEGIKITPQISEREREMLAQIEFLKQQNAQLLAAKNNGTIQLENNHNVEIETSSITGDKQKANPSYHVNDMKQTNRISSVPKDEIKEPLLESDDTPSKTCKDKCSCIIL